MRGAGMKILIVSNKYPPDVVGGAEIVAASLCEDLARRGHEVHVLTASGKPGRTEVSSRHGVTVHRMWPGTGIFPPAGLSRLRSLARQAPVHLLDLWNHLVAAETARIIAALKPRLVHTHNLYGFSPSVWRVAGRHGLPVVHTAHDCYLLSPTGNLLFDWEGDNFVVSAFRTLYRRRYLAQTKRVDVFCSPSQHHLDLHRRLGCRAAACRVVRNGVAQAGKRNGESGTRDEVEATRGAPLGVLYMGRLESHKGVPVLLKAAKKLAGSPLRLVVAGDGTLKPDVRRAAGRLSFLEYAGFVGGEERRRLFQRSDLLIFPSICLECFGTVVLEALACGVPAAVTDIGGPTELIEDGRNGFKIPPGNTNALADLLRDLSAAPEHVRSLRDNARESAAGCTVERMTDEYLRVYAGAAGS